MMRAPLIINDGPFDQGSLVDRDAFPPDRDRSPIDIAATDRTDRATVPRVLAGTQRGYAKRALILWANARCVDQELACAIKTCRKTLALHRDHDQALAQMGTALPGMNLMLSHIPQGNGEFIGLENGQQERMAGRLIDDQNCTYWAA